MQPIALYFIVGAVWLFLHLNCAFVEQTSKGFRYLRRYQMEMTGLITNNVLNFSVLGGLRMRRSLAFVHALVL